MIDKLRRRYFLICTVSVLSVVTLIFFVILILNVSFLNRTMDALADRVAVGGGRFPSFSEPEKHPEKKAPERIPGEDFMTPETPFSTRHFTVFFDEEGQVDRALTDAIAAISEEEAIGYAAQALSDGGERGWIGNYRYKTFSVEFGQGVVFVDGSMNRAATTQTTAIAGIVIFSCAALVLTLFFFLSKKAVAPIAESYEKQKQFITDAGHELKTPLTLILANLDIAEGELGKNEWLEDIRAEGYRMTELVRQLVDLSRMDEEKHKIKMTELPFGKLVEETVSEFEPLAASLGKKLTTQIDGDIRCRGDEEYLRRLVRILMENAVRYCDDQGEIAVSLTRARSVTLTVENTYAAVDEVELKRLFDRFYRADKARTYQGGCGVGLSMAKAIVEKHKGEIGAYRKDSGHIGFSVVLPR